MLIKHLDHTWYITGVQLTLAVIIFTMKAMRSQSRIPRHSGEFQPPKRVRNCTRAPWQRERTWGNQLRRQLFTEHLVCSRQGVTRFTCTIYYSPQHGFKQIINAITIASSLFMRKLGQRNSLNTTGLIPFSYHYISSIASLPVPCPENVSSLCKKNVSQ